MSYVRMKKSKYEVYDLIDVHSKNVIGRARMEKDRKDIIQWKVCIFFFPDNTLSGGIFKCESLDECATIAQNRIIEINALRYARRRKKRKSPNTFPNPRLKID